MSLSDFEFTPAEMREFAEAAEELLHRRSYKAAKRTPKGTDLAALKLMVKHGQNPDVVAVIAGITPEQFQRIIE